MSDRNEVRVSDQDPEVLAMKALSAALQPLDTNARVRLLSWAEDKFVKDVERAVSEEALMGVQAQMEALEKRAKYIGVSMPKLVHAFSAAREAARVAPIEVREDDESAHEMATVEENLRRAAAK